MLPSAGKNPFLFLHVRRNKQPKFVKSKLPRSLSNEVLKLRMRCIIKLSSALVQGQILLLLKLLLKLFLVIPASEVNFETAQRAKHFL